MVSTLPILPASNVALPQSIDFKGKIAEWQRFDERTFDLWCSRNQAKIETNIKKYGIGQVPGVEAWKDIEIYKKAMFLSEQDLAHIDRPLKDRAANYLTVRQSYKFVDASERASNLFGGGENDAKEIAARINASIKSTGSEMLRSFSKR